VIIQFINGVIIDWTDSINTAHNQRYFGYKDNHNYI